MSKENDAGARARAWRDELHREFCDSIEPWEHGTIVRASAFPHYWDMNVVRVEHETNVDVDELIAVADRGLDGLAHRKVEVDPPATGERLRNDFVARGWKDTALVWMRFEGPLPPGPEIAIEEVAYDDVHHLRVTWHEEDFPGIDPGGYYQESKEVALRRGCVVYAALEGDEPVAFAELERRGAGAEIVSVYVALRHRGGGPGHGDHPRGDRGRERCRRPLDRRRR